MTREIQRLLRRVGFVIELERTQMGLTLPALAKRARISKGNLWRIESGADFQLSTFYKICRALDIEPAQMVPNFKLTCLVASRSNRKPATDCASGSGTGKRAAVLCSRGAGPRLTRAISIPKRVGDAWADA